MDFLFTEAREKQGVGPVNDWDMYLHPDFVEYVAARQGSSSMIAPIAIR